MARHVRKGDLVKVIAGNDKGKTGKVLRVIPKEDRVVVEGVNTHHRHVRPSQKNPQGGRITKDMPIHISNVQPISPSGGGVTRVRFEKRDDGSKVRVAVKGGDVLHTMKKAKA